ncbi:MAG: 50S ribosomal protein L30 [Thermoplasmatota archaeon]
MVFAVIRIRSPRNKSKKMENTLNSLRLNKVNHCTILSQNDKYLGMLKNIKDIVTWGEIENDTLVSLLINNSTMEGEITDEYVSENTEYDTIEKFTENVINGEADITDLPDIENIFRLHPPRGGFRSVKKPYETGGSLGYRGKNINNLLEKMFNNKEIKE